MNIVYISLNYNYFEVIESLNKDYKLFIVYVYFEVIESLN